MSGRHQINGEPRSRRCFFCCCFIHCRAPAGVVSGARWGNFSLHSARCFSTVLSVCERGLPRFERR
jgi:hypothetical protein